MRFAQALFGGKFLKPESQEQLLSFVSTGNEGFTYGLGVENLPSPWGNSLGKGGTNLGNTGQILYLPDRGVIAVELENGVNSQAPSPEFGVTSSVLDTLFAQTQGKNSP